MQPEITITWVGHATVLFEVDGFRVITDPILTSRVVHLRRRVEVPDDRPRRRRADLAPPHGPPPPAVAAHRDRAAPA